MKKLLGLSLLILLVLGSCRRPKQIPLSDNPIWPMEIGNEWIFSDSLIHLVDSIPFDTSVLVFSIEVVERGYIDEPVGDRRRLQAWKISTRLGDSCEFFNMIHIDEEGVYNAGWITASNQLQLFEADIVVPYPFNVGGVYGPDGLMWYECPGNPHAERSPILDQTLVLLDDNATFQTSFGPVTGYDFGKEFWAPNIGPIAFTYVEETVDSQTDVVDTYIRKRRLIGYDLVN